MPDVRALARDLLAGLSLLTHPFRAALCRVFRRAPRAAVAPDRARALDLAARRRALMDELRTDSIRRRESAPIELTAFGDRLTRPRRGTLCDTPFAVHPIVVEDKGDWLASEVGGSCDFGGSDTGPAPSRMGD